MTSEVAVNVVRTTSVVVLRELEDVVNALHSCPNGGPVTHVITQLPFLPKALLLILKHWFHRIDVFQDVPAKLLLLSQFPTHFFKSGSKKSLCSWKFTCLFIHYTNILSVCCILELQIWKWRRQIISLFYWSLLVIVKIESASKWEKLVVKNAMQKTKCWSGE